MGHYARSGGRQGGAADYPLASAPYQGDFPTGNVGNVAVGVIDTGIVLQDGLPHPFIRKNLADGWESQQDQIPSDGDPLDRFDCHGTFISGLILLQAPTVTLHVRNVLDRADTADISSDEAVVRAIQELGAVNNLRVINMSFLSPFIQERTPPPLIREALDALISERDGDILFVTAAGNSGTDALTYPAAFSRDFDQVIAVGAVDESIIPIPDNVPPKASFSNYGTWVDGYAPGVRVLGPALAYEEKTGPDGTAPQTFTGWVRWSGTSFAAAQVSGQLARAMVENPGVAALDIRRKVVHGRGLPTPSGPTYAGSPYLPGPDSAWIDPPGEGQS